LPLLTDIGKAISYIYNRIHGEITEFETSLIFGNDETIEDTQLFRISGNIERQPEVVPFNSIDHANSDQFSSKLCFENYSSWLFIPFNILHKIRSDQLEEAFEKYNIPTDLEKLKILLADKFNHKIIAEAFKSIDGDLNTNSLILYSGPEHTSFEHFLIFLQKHNGLGNYFCDFDYRFYFGAGCMYFGDFDAHDSNNWQQFVQFYNKYWKNVQTVQIPHHGSIHSYNKEINYSSKKICLMSAAEKNRYRHPHAATLKEIVKARALPIIVTEHKSTTTIFEITTIDSFYKKILQKRLDQDL
jgi:hypothetical protein